MHDDGITVPLSRGMVALIDAEDAERVLAFKWSVGWSGHHWYARRLDPENRRHIYMHRFIMDAPDNAEVDHIETDRTLDNRRTNLRIATRSENGANRGMQRNNTSGFKGVYPYNRTGRWKAQVRHQGRQIVVGVFDRPEDAARAYDAKARELWGEFAHTNYPDEAA